MKHNNLLTQINFTRRHFEHKTEQIYLKMSFRLEKHAETFISRFHLKKYRLKSYPIDVMSLSQSPRSESYPIYIYAETIHDKWKQTPLSDMSFKTLR